MAKKKDGLKIEDWQMKSLIKRYTIKLGNGMLLVPEPADIYRIVQENLDAVEAAHRKTRVAFKPEVPHTDLNRMSRASQKSLMEQVKSGYLPYALQDEIRDSHQRFNKNYSARSIREAEAWAKKLEKKYPKRKNPGPSFKSRYDRLARLADLADKAFYKAVRKQFPKSRSGDMRYRSDLFNAETKAASNRARRATDMLLNLMRNAKVRN